MGVLRAGYPNFYKGMTKDDLVDIVNLWQDMFRGDDVVIVAAAVKTLMASDEKGFPPVIGQVKQYVRKITCPEEMTDMEAWDLVAKALRNSIYNSATEFAGLPPVIRRIVGDPAKLREWAMMEAEIVQSVVMSGFRKSYAARAQSEREFLAMPAEVRDLMTGIASGMGIPALEEGAKC